jgi:hypothetical protein
MVMVIALTTAIDVVMMMMMLIDVAKTEKDWMIRMDQHPRLSWLALQRRETNASKS